MNRLFSLLLLLGAGAAQADAGVIAVDAELNRLIQQGQAQAAAGFYAPDFLLITGAGGQKDRAAMLREIGSPALRLSRNETEQIKVLRLGDTAVLVGVLHQRGEWQGRAFEHRLRVSDTWVWREGRWLLLAGHASLLKQGQP